MNYELAKELKDKGFPQKHDFGVTVYDTKTTYTFSVSDSDDYDTTGRLPFKNNQSSGLNDRYVFIPTLTELIEACGEAITMDIFEDGSTWVNTNTANPDFLKAQGKTPEVAVAKLWLALNSKES